MEKQTAATQVHASQDDPEAHRSLGETSSNLNNSADEALKVVSQNGPISIDEAANTRLVRKIDLWVMPILCLVYAINYLDKTTLSYASVTGISADLHLRDNDFQWLGSIFYFGYLVFEYPAIRILQKFPISKYSGFCVICWGIIISCSTAVTNFAGALALRCLLGVLEASVSPAWTLLTSQWYTKHEHALRISWWFGVNGLATSFGSLVAYGIAQNIDGIQYTLSPWKVIYLFVGCITIILGIAFLVVIPDRPNEAWWLSKHEQVLVIERVRTNQQGIGNKQFKMYQFKEAFTDPAVYGFLFMGVVALIPNGGLTNYYNLLITSFGYSDLQSLLLGAIEGPIDIFACVLWALFSQRFKQRAMMAFWFSIPGILGSALIVCLPDDMPKGKFAGFMLGAFTTPQVLAVISMISSNIAGYTKKTTVAGLFFISYCVGNIVGPHTFRNSDAPRYIQAQTLIFVCTAACSIDLVFLHWWYRRANRLHAARRGAGGYVKVENQEFLDLTDRENSEFVYEL